MTGGHNFGIIHAKTNMARRAQSAMSPQDVRAGLSCGIDPRIRDPGDYRLASVLVIIRGDDPEVIMTRKPRSMRFHAGEISFPGGKADPADSDLLETALRETREEIGLDISRDRVIGQLDPVVTLNSGFMILPFVSVVGGTGGLRANPEVEQILCIPLGPLLGTMAPDTDPSHNAIREMYTFEYRDDIVWGASARILRQIQNRLGD